MSELTPTQEVCEGCGVIAGGREFRTGDEASYGVIVSARWSSPPSGWLTSYDDSGEHWVCSVSCARKGDSKLRARVVRDEGRKRPCTG